MRGLKSYRRDRATLHVRHLDEFKAWLQHRDGWEIQPPTGHPYEDLYAIKRSRSGDEAFSFIYHNNRNEHLTVQADLVPMVRKFLRERKHGSQKAREV